MPNAALVCHCGQYAMHCWALIRDARTGTHTLTACDPQDVGTSNG